MAGVEQVEARLGDEARQAPLALGGAGRVARGDVDPGDRVSGGGDAHCGGDRVRG